MAGGLRSFGALWPILPGGIEDEATPAGLAPGQMPVNPARDGMAQPNAIGQAMGRALGAKAVGAASGILDALRLPGDAWKGRVDPMSDEGIRRSFDLAGTLTLGGMPMAEAGAAGIFGGKLAKTANRAALDEAQELASVGIPRRAIWDDTGWFQGADKQWRYEIPDNASGYSGSGATLGEALQHPQAFDAYPGLARIGHAQPAALADDTLGLYHGRPGGAPERIEVAQTHAGEAIPGPQRHDVALHEVQHAIQAREGTLRSANPQAAGGDYWTSPIEVEARNVERRRSWSDDERRSTPPWESADVSWPQWGPEDAIPVSGSSANPIALAAAGGAALALPGQAQAAPNSGSQPMVASPFRFGQLPGFAVDDFGRPLVGAQPQMPPPDVDPFSFAPRTVGGMTAPQTGGLLGFGRLPMPQAPDTPAGAPQGFGPGSAAGTLPLPVPQAALPTTRPAPRDVPAVGGAGGGNQPPAVPLPPARPPEFGGAGGAGGAPLDIMPQGAGASPAAAAMTGPSFGDRLSRGLGDNSNFLLALGASLMSRRNPGEALSEALQLNSQLQGSQAARNLAEAKQLSEMQKLAQAQRANNATAQSIARDLGISYEEAQARANNPQFVSDYFKRGLPPEENYGQETDPQGNVWTINRKTGQRTIALQAKEARGPTVQSIEGPNGKESRVWNAETRSFDPVPYGANPPVAQAEDTTGIPPGVDADTYRKELAKKTVAQQNTATTRAALSREVLPILDRAERAYSALGEMSGIGPINASSGNRWVAGAFGTSAEKMRQEFEAASRDLELYKAQITMKGQGSITDSERRLLALTLPRLDAADPGTGLRTLQAMREQFSRALSAEQLPSYGAGTRAPAQGAADQTQRRRATRYEELIGSGMSKQDAFARMRQEGL